MPKTRISEFDTVAANNTDIDGINLGEGMLPSDVNNAIRELMSQLKDFQTGAGGDSFNGPIGSTTPVAGSFTSLTDSGNLTFTGTGNRITGDFSNATVANRVMFQTSTTNANTRVGIIPNGTGTITAIDLHSTADPTNTSRANLGIIGGSEARLTSDALGSGTQLPLTFNVGGSERLRIDTSGNVGIGTSSPSARLDVRTAAGTAAQQNIYTGSNAAAATLQFGQVGAVAWDLGITASGGNFQIGINGGGLGYNINRSGASIDYHSWLTSGSERMRIDSSGNVLIGTTTSPSGSNKLISTGGIESTRITPRVSTTTSSATPTINTDTTDIFGLTAQAVDITSFTTNLSGTPTNGQKLWIYIVGTAARAITWGASFEASTVALPTTTVTTNRLDVGFVWNAATSKWRCVAVA